MYESVLASEVSRNYFEYQEELVSNAIASIKNYFVENKEIIALGLASLNSNYVPMNRK